MQGNAKTTISRDSNRFHPANWPLISSNSTLHFRRAPPPPKLSWHMAPSGGKPLHPSPNEPHCFLFIADKFAHNPTVRQLSVILLSLSPKWRSLLLYRKEETTFSTLPSPHFSGTQRDKIKNQVTYIFMISYVAFWGLYSKGS